MATKIKPFNLHTSVDTHVKGLIDYNYKPKKYRKHKRFIYSDDDDDFIEKDSYYEYDDKDYVEEDEEYVDEEDEEYVDEDEEEYVDEEDEDNREVINAHILPNLFNLFGGGNNKNKNDEYDEYFKTLDKTEQNELKERIKIKLDTFNYNGGLQVSSDTANIVKSASVPIEQYTEKVDLRVRGRSIAIKISSDQVGTTWRTGLNRLDIRPDGKR